jgi:hypothetical protein
MHSLLHRSVLLEFNQYLDYLLNVLIAIYTSKKGYVQVLRAQVYEF